MHCNFTSYVCASSLLDFPQVLIDFWHDCITCKRRYFYLQFAGNFTCSSQVKRPHTQFTCVTCSLPVKTSNFTCFYATSTSRKIHTIALNEARKLQVTSPSWCRLTYLQFAGDFTRGCDSRLPAIAVNSVWNCRFVCLWLCGYLFLGLQSFFPGFTWVMFTCVSSVFACKLHVFLPAEEGIFVC